ncbi:hypothetical protein CCACVL1_05968 [Corchorus capsularis]|uniref:ubiquitinyl hydrolase 1 n=1 Tax=Corchorus capsularis TaxID=210143 RepID=A0A1R3JHZ2_COCAP|nr:hypothetical protein CCACVL1_05968 [Corchorus capsularis]
MFFLTRLYFQQGRFEEVDLPLLIVYGGDGIVSDPACVEDLNVSLQKETKRYKQPHKTLKMCIFGDEVLDIPLPELQDLKTLKVALHLATKDEVVIHTIRLPKQSTVVDVDVLDDLKTKVELSHPSAELILFEVEKHKIYRIFEPSGKIEYIDDVYSKLRVEERIQNFGEPFLSLVREGETLAQVKVRIRKKLQVPDEEFAKWKSAVLSPIGTLKSQYLQDSDVVSTFFQLMKLAAHKAYLLKQAAWLTNC